MKKLNLGCGYDLKEGYINIDIQKPCDMLLNIERDKLPFEDNSVDYITCERTLAHLSDITHFMGECHRVLKKGGTLHLTVMYFRHPMAFNPSHKLFFNLYSFDSWCGGSRTMSYPVKYIKKSIGFIGIPKKWVKWIADRNIWLYQNIFGIFFPAMEMEVILEK